jgi:hypothetical protein
MKVFEEEEIPKHRSKKNTKKWCRGKPGIVHTPRWELWDRFLGFAKNKQDQYLIYKCTKCGKQFDTYFPTFDRKYKQPIVGQQTPKEIK